MFNISETSADFDVALISETAAVDPWDMRNILAGSTLICNTLFLT
jgi:hypothetical protein